MDGSSSAGRSNPGEELLLTSTMEALTRGQGNFTKDELLAAVKELNRIALQTGMLVLLFEGKLELRFRDDGELEFDGTKTDLDANALAERMGRLLAYAIEGKGPPPPRRPQG